jgi:predicted TIM-barrel fold metal-dependent hydrolase
MIVDVHVHLGYDYTFDEDFTREELIEKIDTYSVDVQIVQPGTCHDLETVREQHDVIAALCREFPKKFFGMANPSPHLKTEQYNDEISRCVEELGFIAVKLNTIAHGVNPNTRAGRMVFDAAQKHRIPLMVHTGAGVPFAGPVHLLGMAKEYPDVQIIMAHCGMIVFANEVTAVFDACENVYGDTSWSPGFFIKNWLRTYGPRLMLGSDHADNTGTELAKIRTVGLKPEEQESVLGGTAAQVFKFS